MAYMGAFPVDSVPDMVRGGFGPDREGSLSGIESALRSCQIGSEDGRNAELPEQCGVLRVVLGTSAPFKIGQVSTDLLDLFQLSAPQCIGRTMGVLSGPGTNTKTLTELIEAARFGKEARAVLMLYSRSGAGDSFCVNAQPYFSDGGELNGCLLEMQPCKAQTLKVAAQDDGRAKAIVEADQFFRAVFCSQEFEALYGLVEPMVLGRTLNLIHGPTTDRRTWMRLLDSACRGISMSAPLVTSTNDCREFEITLETQPIVSALGYITHILVITAPSVPLPHEPPSPREPEYALHQAPTQDFTDWHVPHPADARPALRHPKLGSAPCGGLAPPTNMLRGSLARLPQHSHLHPADFIEDVPRRLPSHRLPHAHLPVNLEEIPEDGRFQPSGPDALQSDATLAMVSRHPALDARFHHPAIRQHRHRGTVPQAPRLMGVSTVIPRRKAGQASHDISTPVNITLETLELYSNVPLSKAATLLGISSTAMKKACRKLGVTRWPYTAPSLAKNTNLPPNPHVTHVDSAYVRKLFRKYSGNARIKDFSVESLPSASSGCSAAVSSSNSSGGAPSPDVSAYECAATAADGDLDVSAAAAGGDGVVRLESLHAAADASGAGGAL